jgi:chaperone BCS1
MSDNTLTTLMGNVPQRLMRLTLIQSSNFNITFIRCILLLEDLDAAFTRSVSRDEKSTGAPTAATAKDAAATEATDGSTLSLSGLLNSLDGVAAAEGRYANM